MVLQPKVTIGYMSRLTNHNYVATEGCTGFELTFRIKFVLAIMSVLVMSNVNAFNLMNKIHGGIDTFMFILGRNGKSEYRRSSPSPFNFNVTNISYEIEFSPSSPRPYDIGVVYPYSNRPWYGTDIAYKEFSTTNFLARITVIHNGKTYRQWLSHDVATDFYDRYSDQHNVRHILSRRSFSAADFPWYYKEPIIVRVELIQNVEAQCMLSKVSAPLAIYEGFPIE